MKGNVKCSCGHSWSKSKSSKEDMNVCHICGKDNTMKDGGWLDQYKEGGVAKTDATRVAAPNLKLTKAQLEKNKAINKQVMANTEKANAKKLAARKKAIAESSEADIINPNGKRFAIGDKFRMFPNDIGGYGEAFDDFINPAVFVGNTASGLGNAMIDRDAGAFATEAGMALGAGALGFDPLGGAMKLPGKLDKVIYPTRTYRASLPAGNTSPYEVSALAEKVAGKGDWSTKDLSEAAQYLSGSEMSGGRPGLLTGQNMNLTEYKVPFWKKSVASDADVIALKASQGTVPNPNEYIIPDNKFLYPRRTNVLQQVPENVKNAKFTIGSGEQFPYYNPSTMPGSYSSDTFRSPAYKYIEDQINAVTGQQMPLTYTAEQAAANQIPMFNWKQPQIAPNAGMGEFSGLGDYLTTQTPLANAYKINPFAFKPTEGMMYRGLGEEGYQDALQSGVFRAKQNVEPSMIGGLNMAKSFGTNPYFTPKFKTAESYGSKYLAEVPESAANWRQRYKRTDWSQVADRPIPINEGRILQKDWLQGYKPIKEDGGWLDKYNDGGPIQPNYNDYSVSAGLGFQGDGYSNVGRNYSPAWGGQFQKGGTIKRFMQPTETFKNFGYNPIENGLSTEYSTSIGGPGEVYLVPGYRQGRVLDDPEATFNMYGEHLGGPFKTVKAAEDFAKFRHDYVEKNKNIPSPFKTRDYAMGGSIGGATQGIPGATGFMYARTGTIPSNGKYAKKTKASAQDGLKLIGGEETQPVKTPAVKSEERIKAQENIMNRAPLDIIEEGRSKFRFNMLKDAVKHDMAIEQGIGLDDINQKDLKKKTMELLLKRESKLSNPTVEFVKGNGAAGTASDNQVILGYYDPTNKNALVSLSDNLDKFDVSKFEGTTRHEFRHAYDDGGRYLTNYEKELISRKTNANNVEKQKALGNERYSYLQNPTEVTARLQDIRGALKDNPRILNYLKKKDNDPSWYKEDYKLDREGYYIDPETRQRIPVKKYYDPKKDKAAYEDLYYLNEKTNNAGLQDLLKVMEADDIVDLLNTIAANTPQQGMPMAQNGMEMSYYQNGLDFQPKSISKNGKKIIKDDMGQWAHPGEITEIDSNQITMQGVDYPVLGISDTGDMQMMYPDEEYEFIGDSVTEYPMMKQGGQLTKLDQLSNFTNYNTKQPGGWLDKYQ